VILNPRDNAGTVAKHYYEDQGIGSAGTVWCKIAYIFKELPAGSLLVAFLYYCLALRTEATLLRNMYVFLSQFWAIPSNS
jgi:hypothetical protein